MEYLIYSYGGGDLLIHIFNSIGMIFKSDNTYLTPVGTMALTLGGIYIAIKAVLTGNIEIAIKSWLVPSIITMLLMFSPKSTVWIKDEVALTAPVKIDHIPIGISFFTSVSSRIAHHLSVLIEETMLPANQSKGTATGIFYGAKAVAKVRDIQIQDPVLLRNTKEYLRQCFMKPYVMGNFGGHHAASIRTPDLLGYLDTNPVKCFGIKPTLKDGSVGNFITCTEAGKMIKNDLIAESKSPLLMKQFAASLGISTSNETLMNQRIKAMTGDTFRYLEQGQEDVTEWMKQAMMLNANRESYDDWREKVGHPRIFPNLVKMQATRGLFQQSMGSIVGAEMSESMIPVAAQPAMLALVVLLFVIVLPFALLPGGWSYIVTGVKLMIWVASWPVFYTIIHAIAMIQLKDSIGAWGEGGLSLIGQAGFTELIVMRYATTQSLITATPFISFAIVFGSPYALSSIAGSVAGVGASTSIGSNMADGNLAMNQVSYNNTTKDQQNVAPNLLMSGGVIDDGAMRVQSDGTGRQILTEYNDQLVNNVSGAEMISSSASRSLSNTKSDMASLTQREGEVQTLINSEAQDLARSIASGNATAQGLSVSDTEAIRNAHSKTSSASENNSVVDSKATGTNTNLSIGMPPAVSAVTRVQGSTGTSATNTHEIRKDMSQQEIAAYNTAVEHVKNAARNDSITSTNSEDMRLSKSLAANLNTQEQIASDKAKTQQNIDTYTNQVHYAQQNSGTINRNLNEPFLQEVMAQHPELTSKEQALRWSKAHQAESNQIAQKVISQNNPFDSADYKSYVERITGNAPSVQNTGIASSSNLEAKYNNTAEAIGREAIVKDATGSKRTLAASVSGAVNNSNLNYNQDLKDTLKNSMNPEEKEIINQLENEKRKGDDSTSKKVNKVLKDEEKSPTSSDSTIYRAVEQAGYNARISDRAIQEKNLTLPGKEDEGKK